MIIDDVLIALSVFERSINIIRDEGVASGSDEYFLLTLPARMVVSEAINAFVPNDASDRSRSRSMADAVLELFANQHRVHDGRVSIKSQSMGQLATTFQGKKDTGVTDQWLFPDMSRIIYLESTNEYVVDLKGQES